MANHPSTVEDLVARRALLIGAQTGRLTGVGRDVATLAAVLAEWEFTSVRCAAENASRDGILDAYDRFIAETGPRDAVVVYYSGHGGYAEVPGDRQVPPHRRKFQFIVPTDYDEFA